MRSSHGGRFLADVAARGGIAGDRGDLPHCGRVVARGARASLVAALASALGIVPHMAAITGLPAILRASALVFQAIKNLGVAYLLYMAWMTLKEDGPLKIEDERAASAQSLSQVMIAGVLATFLNPKLSIFFLAFLPQCHLPVLRSISVRAARGRSAS